MTGNENREKSIWVTALGVTDYEEILALQKNLFQLKYRESVQEDVILYLQHKRVFTLGKRGGRDNLLVSDDFLNKEGIPIIQTERGGNITFHGPGQLVIYPIIDLKRLNIGIADFVSACERIVTAALHHFNIDGTGNSKNRGVWIDNRKIASIGFALYHKITYHGISINVDLPLAPFSWINPCGLDNIEVTSITKETGEAISVEVVAKKILEEFQNEFLFIPESIPYDELQKRIMYRINSDD